MVEKIQDGVVVTMSYLMTIDGEEIENAPVDDPMYYLHGSGAILPKLEAELAGKVIGDEVNVAVLMEPEIWEADRTDFDNLPDDIKVGDEIDIYDMDGDMMRATVHAISEETVTLNLVDVEDWMVGKTANFKVKVLGLRAATEEEIEYGEPEEYFDFLDDEDDDDHDHD